MIADEMPAGLSSTFKYFVGISFQTSFSNTLKILFFCILYIYFFLLLVLFSYFTIIYNVLKYTTAGVPGQSRSFVTLIRCNLSIGLILNLFKFVRFH